MLTDSPACKNRAQFSESDRVKTLELPRNGASEIAQRLESAMKSDKIRDVWSACTEFLATASDFYESQPAPSWYKPQDFYSPASMGHSNSSVTTRPTPC